MDGFVGGVYQLVVAAFWGAFGGCIVHQRTPGLASSNVSVARQYITEKWALLTWPPGKFQQFTTAHAIKIAGEMM